MQYPTTAREAWSRPRGVGVRLRSAARAGLLWRESVRRPRPRERFVRCLYGHAAFAEQRGSIRRFIAELRDMGEFIGTADLLRILKDGREPDGRFFHLSFDDGFAGVFEHAGPVLADAGVPWTMFVATDLVEASDAALTDYFRSLNAYARPVEVADWATIVEAARGGLVEIGCHTRTHARLSAISGDPARLRDEVAGAKRILEERTGRPCTAFAWPYGTAADIDEVARQAIRDAGFDIAFSAVRGRVVPGGTDAFDVPRHQIEFHWPLHEQLVWARGYREP